MENYRTDKEKSYDNAKPELKVFINEKLYEELDR